jgi:hypothetical protein
LIFENKETYQLSFFQKLAAIKLTANILSKFRDPKSPCPTEKIEAMNINTIDTVVYALA